MSSINPNPPESADVYSKPLGQPKTSGSSKNEIPYKSKTGSFNSTLLNTAADPSKVAKITGRGTGAPETSETTRANSIGSRFFKAISDKISSWMKPDTARNTPENIKETLNKTINKKMHGGRLTKSMNQENALKASVNSLDKAQLSVLKKPENLIKILVDDNNPTLYNAIHVKLSPKELQDFSGELVECTIKSLIEDFNDLKQTGLKDGIAAKNAINKLNKNQIAAFSSDENSIQKILGYCANAPDLVIEIFNKLSSEKKKQAADDIIRPDMDKFKSLEVTLSSIELSPLLNHAFLNHPDLTNKLTNIFDAHPRVFSALFNSLAEMLPLDKRQEVAGEVFKKICDNLLKVKYSVNENLTPQSTLIYIDNLPKANSIFSNDPNAAQKLVGLYTTYNAGFEALIPKMPKILQQEVYGRLAGSIIKKFQSDYTTATSQGNKPSDAAFSAVPILAETQIKALTHPNAYVILAGLKQSNKELYNTTMSRLPPEKTKEIDEGVEQVKKDVPSANIASAAAPRPTEMITLKGKFEQFIRKEPELIPAAFKILSRLLETAPTKSNLTPREKDRLAQIKKEIDENISFNTKLDDAIREINLNNVNVLSDADKTTVKQLKKQKKELDTNLLFEAGTLVKKGFDNNKGVFGTPQDLRDEFARFNKNYLGNAFE